MKISEELNTTETYYDNVSFYSLKKLFFSLTLILYIMFDFYILYILFSLKKGERELLDFLRV